jgi:hypothetical protein
MKLKEADARYRKFFSLIIFSFLIISSLGFVIAAEDDGAGSTGGSGININFLGNEPKGATWLDQTPSESESSGAQFFARIMAFLGIGETWKQIIVGIIVFLIIFAGLRDILTLTSLFEKANFIIAFGLAVIAMLSGLVNGIATAMLSLAATLGTLGIVLEIIIAIVIFIGLTVANERISMFAAKKYAVNAKVKGLKSGAEGAAGFKALRDLFKEMK